MLLLPFKVLFIVAVFGVWNKTGNAILAAGIWTLASFLINVLASGLSVFACCWAGASFLVALAVFLGLAYIQRSFWMIPGAVLGSFILVVFF
ncbi:MAG: hypothetical protein PVH87_18175 [Desulfobacteraceae bacterium]|jgi:hypothetical protein